MMASRTRPVLVMLAILLFSSLSPLLVSASTSGRAQISWSGDVTLNNHFTIPVTDELVISPCTNVTMANGVRIFVEGRLTVEGTETCPVYFDYAGGGDHMGIQFNSSSNGRGSKIDNASIIHSTYGITIYGSNPYLANVTIWDADDVAVDLFNGATPTIRDLVIDEAGQDWSIPTYWRYGIGLSVGNGSAPNVDGLEIRDAVTRGLNMWRNSGGLFRNITIENVTGATLAASAAIWVEDSRPLIEFIDVDRSDHGAIIRHMDDAFITRAVMRDVSISNSMYKAILLDKDDRTNYTNYQSAIIEGLSITGTGGPDAKTPGLATTAIEINATGAWIEDAVLDDNDAVGIQLYFVDSSTNFQNLSINNTGGSGTGANAAGISVTSSYFAANFDGLEVANSTGPGVFTISGGAIQGQNWYLHDNGQEGFKLERAATIVDGLILEDNGDSGVHIDDARYVYLSNLTSSGNADAGMEFTKSNDVETTSGDVRCFNCTSVTDATGISVTDSVDIYLESIQVHDPVSGPAIAIDNGGLNIGVQGGTFHLNNTTVWVNTSGPAISIDRAEGVIDGLEMFGSHSGLVWDADHNVERNSVLSNANLSGSGCLSLSNHDQLSGSGNRIMSTCSGTIDFVDTIANFSGLIDESNHVFNVDTGSRVHLHQPNGVDYASANISGNGWIEEAWNLDVWVVNNNSNGIPAADVELSFDQLESSMSETTDEFGFVLIQDLRGKRFTSLGESPYTTVTIECSYDGVTNSTNTTLDQDRSVWCHLPLENQAPFLNWDTPIDQQVFPSNSDVQFNASRSWDLDDDLMIFTWTSSIDGVFGSSSDFRVNDGTSTEIPLSDGIHDITLEVCDDKGNCAEETRTIELSNQPPVIVIDTDPGLSPWGELIIPITRPVTFWLNDTYDPEGDALTCTWSWPGNQQVLTQCENATGNLSFSNMTSSTFDLTLTVDDGINTPSQWVIPVELYNEMPVASFEVIRAGNLSENQVELLSTSIDPEGDSITYLWESSIDGILSNQSNWSGYLSRGNHVISLSVNDGRMEHLNMTSINSTVVQVENSPPRAVIHQPVANTSYDSSNLFEFNASGSGDWDSACTTFPVDIHWHCSAEEPASGSEWLIYSWQSDIDGILQEDGVDWLIFESYLSSGMHTITLTIDDGINPPVSTSVEINVLPSAPVLGLVLPDTNIGYHSNEIIYFDISESVDNDGDDFTFSLSSDLDGSLLEEADPMGIHSLQLSAGEHNLSITLVDDTGMSRVETIQLIVVESDPDAVVYEPMDGQYFAPGEPVILDSNGTNDADGDITRREWRLYNSEELYPEILSTNEYEELYLSPGAKHISLYVEDRRGGSTEVHLNITVAASNPVLSNISTNSKSYPVNELTKIVVTVDLKDADGTTEQVYATITKNLQVWTFNLTDLDGDGQWTGELEFRPGETGIAQLKITAVDGEVIDQISTNLEFNEEETDNSSMMIVIGSIAGLALASFLVVMLISRRRKRLADLELIDSWGVFGGESKEYLDDDAELN